MGIENIEPSVSKELFGKIREAVETGKVPESPVDESKLIKEAKLAERKKRGFEQTGAHAIAEWQKKEEEKEEQRRLRRN